MRLQRSLRPLRLLRLLRSLRPFRCLMPGKSLKYVNCKLSFSPKMDKNAKNVEKKIFGSSFTFVTYKLFFAKLFFKFLHIILQRAHNIKKTKNWLDRQNIGFLRNTQDLSYQKKVKCTSSPESIYFTQFAMRHPVEGQWLSVVEFLSSGIKNSLDLCRKVRVFKGLCDIF